MNFKNLQIFLKNASFLKCVKIYRKQNFKLFGVFQVGQTSLQPHKRQFYKTTLKTIFS